MSLMHTCRQLSVLDLPIVLLQTVLDAGVLQLTSAQRGPPPSHVCQRLTPREPVVPEEKVN